MNGRAVTNLRPKRRRMRTRSRSRDTSRANSGRPPIATELDPSPERAVVDLGANEDGYGTDTHI